MEIKAGEGGAESALFAADLLRMYIQYAASKGWKTELLDRNESDLGGYKDVQIAIKGSSSDPAQGVWAHLKYEGGVHRVQRVPATESQGRIHTSTTGVLVFPEVDEPEDDAMALLLGAEIDRPKPVDEESEERMLRMMLEANSRG